MVRAKRQKSNYGREVLFSCDCMANITAPGDCYRWCANTKFVLVVTDNTVIG